MHDPYTSIDGKLTYFTLSTYTDLKIMDSVVAVDLNLNNVWFQKMITKYLDDKNFEKWFLSKKDSNLVALKSTDILYLKPV